MSRSSKIFTLIIIILGLIIMWLVYHDRFAKTGDKPTPIEVPSVNVPLVREQQKYENSTYGFSFSYPEGYKLLAPSPELMTIGRETLRGVDPLVQIVLVKSGTDTGVTPYEEFVIDGAREYCISKKANSSSECTRIDDVVNIAPFKSKSGVAGQVFYLKYEETNFETGKTTRGRRGPFYTFNTSLSTPNEMSFLMIYNPISIPAEKANEALIRGVAESYRYTH